MVGEVVVCGGVTVVDATELTVGEREELATFETETTVVEKVVVDIVLDIV